MRQIDSLFQAGECANFPAFCFISDYVIGSSSRLFDCYDTCFLVFDNLHAAIVVDGAEHLSERFPVDECERVAGLLQFFAEDDDLHVEYPFELRCDLRQALVVEIESAVAPRAVGVRRNVRSFDIPGGPVVTDDITGTQVYAAFLLRPVRIQKDRTLQQAYRHGIRVFVGIEVEFGAQDLYADVVGLEDEGAFAILLHVEEGFAGDEDLAAPASELHGIDDFRTRIEPDHRVVRQTDGVLPAVGNCEFEVVRVRGRRAVP